jgi:hypothetical protein
LVSKLSELDELIDEEKRKWKQQVSQISSSSPFPPPSCPHENRMKLKRMLMFLGEPKN